VRNALGNVTNISDGLGLHRSEVILAGLKQGVMPHIDRVSLKVSDLSLRGSTCFNVDLNINVVG